MAYRFQSSDEKLLRSGLFSDVTVRCGEKTWRLHKNLLCSRSTWFEKALNGHFQEAHTGEVNISNFDAEPIGWLIEYIYTAQCAIRDLRPERQTILATCIEVYNVGDYFAMTALTQVALDTLAQEFDARQPRIQQLCQQTPSPDSQSLATLAADALSIDWLDEFLHAVRLVYQDVPQGDTTLPLPALRTAFVTFAHSARHVFLQDSTFSIFLDASPTFALDLFRAMRRSADFAINPLEPACSACKGKPARVTPERPYFTHVAPQRLSLLACCANCAGPQKRDLPSATGDWLGKAGPVPTEKNQLEKLLSGAGEMMSLMNYNWESFTDAERAGSRRRRRPE